MPRKRNDQTETNNTGEQTDMSATDFDTSLFEELSAEEADAALASGADKGQFDTVLDAFFKSGLYAVAVPLDRGPLQGRDPAKARQSLTSARDRTKKNEGGVSETVHPEWAVIKIRRQKGVDNKIFLVNTAAKPAS